MRAIVNIDVPDLPSAVAFYSKALGLQLQRIIDGDVAELIGASTTIYLLAKPAGSDTSDSAEARASASTRDYSRHWTPVHLDFVVPDVEQAAQRVQDAGARREGECVAWRGSKCITFADPFGHGFCLIEFESDTYSDT